MHKCRLVSIECNNLESISTSFTTGTYFRAKTSFEEQVGLLFTKTCIFGRHQIPASLKSFSLTCLVVFICISKQMPQQYIEVRQSASFRILPCSPFMIISRLTEHFFSTEYFLWIHLYPPKFLALLHGKET